jgi:hypothetical protein
MRRSEGVSQTVRVQWLTLCFALVTCFGCGKTERAETSLRLTDDVDVTALAHTPTKNTEQVLERVDELLAAVSSEKMPERFPNWIAFHALLMYGQSAYREYETGEADENLKRIFAVILNSDTSGNGPYLVRGGLPFPRHDGPYFSQEHHPNQFLTYFSMSGGTLDAPITVDGAKYTFLDLLDRSLLESRASGELAYTVLAFSHYLDTGKRWENKFGESMSLAVLLERLLKTPERTCLGTHRLGALARTLSRPELRADPNVERLWPELERQVHAALLDLKRSQRPDGGFHIPGAVPGTPTPEHQDIYYSGHSLEWITFLAPGYAPDDWVVLAVDRLRQAIEVTYQGTYRNMDTEGDEQSHFDFDGLSHATSALRRWRDRLLVSAEVLQQSQGKEAARYAKW